MCPASRQTSHAHSSTNNNNILQLLSPCPRASPSSTCCSFCCWPGRFTVRFGLAFWLFCALMSKLLCNLISQLRIMFTPSARFTVLRYFPPSSKDEDEHSSAACFSFLFFIFLHLTPALFRVLSYSFPSSLSTGTARSR